MKTPDGASHGDARKSSDLFVEGGQMGGLMRELDWSTTVLGPAEAWPAALLPALSICLGSSFPIAIYWGRQLALLYNDAWSPILGEKHPWALGHPAREVWPEIWSTIGPMFQQVMATGKATYSEDGLLPMHRHGYTEECYFNFSFSPIRGERGVEGIFNAVVETTYRVVSDRRTRVLRELGERLYDARSTDDVFRLTSQVLQSAGADVPFSLVYVADEARGEARLVARVGLEGGSEAAPVVLALHDEAAAWPLAKVFRSRRVESVHRLGERFTTPLPGGDWPESSSAAMVTPIVLPSSDRAAAFLVLGTSPRRAIDEQYVQFAERLAAQIAVGLASAQAYEEEKKRREALAEIDRAKTAFFSNVSHEFRTPLTLMLGPTEDALSAGVPLEGEALRAVYRNELRLLKLVNSLLDFARMEAGRAQACFEPTDLAPLTCDLASAFRAAIERAGLTYRADCAPLPEPIYVDRTLWEKVILNLLSNALKYTFEGTISLSVRATTDGAEVRVTDTGTGIAAEELPRMFERFHRIEGARGRTHEGSGIGLALVSEIVHLHGGTVAVESEPGKGSTFLVRLRRGTAHLPQERLGARSSVESTAAQAAAFVEEALRWLPETTSTAGATLTAVPASPLAEATAGARILLADDNADMRDYVGRLLSQRWKVEAVANGAEALAAARREKPDLIVSDVMMPVLDGLGLLAAARSDAELRSVPVILVSARAGEESRVEGLEAGADDYLVKPFAARELFARVATHLHLSGLRKSLERARGEAEQAGRAKDEFLAMLGHELRNPLAPILTAIHLVKLRGSDGIAREVNVIERQTAHLVRLVEDLLDVSRIAQGKVQLHQENVEIAEVIASAIEMASPLIETSRHQLAADVPKHGLVVRVDRTRMAQVLGNLLTNAAKYTPSGGRIAISAVRAEDRIVVRVEDTGSGITPELLPRVFDLFVQSRQTIDRSQGGLGLGLTIVKSIVSMHGGAVTAESPGPGKGSTFAVSLPAAEARPLAAESEEKHPPSPSGKLTRRILVVDDNEDAAEMLAEFLGGLGYATAVAHDGPAALRLAEQFLPDAALLDIGLPVMDGYELAGQLQAQVRESRRELFLVALTGYGMDADKKRSRETGFAKHITKPVNLGALAQLLEAQLAAKADGTG